MRAIKPDYVCSDKTCKAVATIKNARMGVDHSDTCSRAADIYERWPLLSTRIFIERMQSDATT